MNIVVFENEFESVRGSFSATNLIHFNKTLNITNFASSQACRDLSLIDKKSCIFVDIDLSSKSALDGFELIDELIRRGFSKNQLIILTGHINISEKANERGLGDLSIVTKPVDFKALYKVLSNHQTLMPSL